jgi:ankyrin repeat protein
MRRLVNEGADVNQADPDGQWTHLHHAIDVEADAAAQTGEPLTVEVTRLLLELGADPTIADHRGRTALQEAEYRGHVLALQLGRDPTGARADPG